MGHFGKGRTDHWDFKVPGLQQEGTLDKLLGHRDFFPGLGQGVFKG